jgi:hypothetical protein
MRSSTLIFFFALITITVCNANTCMKRSPSEPEWPSEFSARVEWRANYHPYHRTFNMFWDEENNRARFDSLLEHRREHYRLEALYDGDEEMAYYIFFYHPLHHEEFKCFTVKLHDVNITGPDLSDAKFKGEDVIDYNQVYEWEKTVKKKDKKIRLEFSDTQDDREVKGLDYDVLEECKSGSMTFHEVNYGLQDKSLFKIPDLILKKCTEKMPLDDFSGMTDPVFLFNLLSKN